MAGYFLVDIEWTDDEGRARYVDSVGDVVAALEWYGSEEYAPLHRIREQSARTNMIFFDGE